MNKGICNSLASSISLVAGFVIVSVMNSCNGDIKPVEVNLVSVEIDDSSHPALPPGPSFPTLQDWLTWIAEHEDPDKSIIAFYFGLAETTEGYKIYLSGSKIYDKKDDDWAIEDDYKPSSHRYHTLSKEFQQLNWEDVQTKIQAELKKFKTTDKFKKSFFAKAKAIAMGFDDGDLILIK